MLYGGWDPKTPKGGTATCGGARGPAVCPQARDSPALSTSPPPPRTGPDLGLSGDGVSQALSAAGRSAPTSGFSQAGSHPGRARHPEPPGGTWRQEAKTVPTTLPGPRSLLWEVGAGQRCAQGTSPAIRVLLWLLPRPLLQGPFRSGRGFPPAAGTLRSRTISPIREYRGSPGTGARAGGGPWGAQGWPPQ